MARRRPSAFDVSFPEEAAKRAAVVAEQANTSKTTNAPALESRSSSVGSSSSLGKRKSGGDGPGDRRVPKRQQLPKTAYYRKQSGEVAENEKLIIDGEDPEPDDDDDDEKPIRELYDFFIFDPTRQNELVSLAALEQDDGVDRQFEAAGKVVPHFASDEDDGQEDEDAEVQPKRVHLSAILRYTMDYTKESEPFYIETQYAWYILKTPADRYKAFYEHFYTPRRIAQLVISWALKRPQDGFPTFLGKFTSRVDMFGRTYLEQHLWDSIVEIQECIRDEPEARKIMAVPFVRLILRNAPAIAETRRPARRNAPRNKHLPKNKAFTGNPDLAVLKAENQNTTHVTPRIADLAQGLFREEIEVIGPPPPPINKAQVDAEKKRAFELLRHLVARAKKNKRSIDYRKEDRVGAEVDKFYKAVNIDGKFYNIGDIVLIPQDEKFKGNGPSPQPGDSIADFFWFAILHYVVMDSQNAHIQWLWHGSQTIMDELAHHQELFLDSTCTTISLHAIVGKVTAHFLPEANNVVKRDEYFCKFMYDDNLCTYTSMDAKRLELFASQEPPNNCFVCALTAQQNLEAAPQELKDDQGILNGVAFGGRHFHLEDFALYRASSGPANIGFIINIEFAKRSTTITMRKVGRISTLGRLLPKAMIRDERHLYLTNEKVKIQVHDLLRVIYVPCIQSFEPPRVTLGDWLNLSYNHFYLRYMFPRLKVESWDDRRKVTWPELLVCTPCCKDRLKGRKLIYEFLQQSESRLLPTLDLFGGVGAFSRGLAEGSGCLDITHAIEISPSAAKTFMRNSPDTIVYNQCANIILRYAIKAQEGHQTEAPTQLFDGKITVPPPPKRGQIKVITAGFPCQSHSTLNMYKKADDVKSNLILTTLSYMDFYSPTFSYFENVPGFLNFHLRAERANQHQANGEIERGGLKLLIRALIDMKYQVRFGILQAAHYGTPQRRERFFLIAAKDGHILPQFPQPTHDFPGTKELPVNNGSGRIIPIRVANGTAAHPVVTIEDAIGDLPRFDWKHPRPDVEPLERRQKRRKREQTIPSLECKTSEPYCGFRGQIGYHHEPQTTYQYTARLNPTTDIQHYTKCLLPKKVERVVNVPMTVGADYRDLPLDQLEWQTANPSSSIARLNYRPGVYGRLEKDGVFPTTVTNVDPTAKQSRVLHPYCYRMVTVRELARSQGFPDSFNFEAIGKHIVTMHRQIGNAVPIPLAHALGRQLRKSLFNKWKTQRQEVITIDDDDEEDDISAPHHLQVPANDDSDESMDIYE